MSRPFRLHRATHYAWFVDELETTKTTCKLRANEVTLMLLKFGPPYIDLDQWDGYQWHDHTADGYARPIGDLHRPLNQVKLTKT